MNSREWLLHVDPVTWLRTRTGGNAQHGGVHVRGLEHVEASASEVKRASTIVKRSNAVSRSTSHHYQLRTGSAGDGRSPVTGSGEGCWANGNHVGVKAEHGFVPQPQVGSGSYHHAMHDGCSNLPYHCPDVAEMQGEIIAEFTCDGNGFVRTRVVAA